MLWVLILHKNVCCGYSLESPRWGDSHEHPQHTFLWRIDEHYPLIITKYPLYLFHWYCHSNFVRLVSLDPPCWRNQTYSVHNFNPINSQWRNFYIADLIFVCIYSKGVFVVSPIFCKRNEYYSCWKFFKILLKLCPSVSSKKESNISCVRSLKT